jgi:Uma2 family endonuclease
MHETHFAKGGDSLELAMEPALQFTRKDYDQLPEDLRVELIDGQLLKMPSPVVRHQKLMQRLNAALMQLVGVDRVLPGPVDFAIDNYNVLVPDLVVHRANELPADGARDITTALVVIEVLSPSTAARDRKIKRGKYLDAGAGEVWLIDGGKQRIETYTSDVECTLDRDATLSSTSLPGLELSLAELFG